MTAAVVHYLGGFIGGLLGGAVAFWWGYCIGWRHANTLARVALERRK